MTCASKSRYASIRGRGECTVLSEGTPKELVINQGSWSDWLRVKFKLGMLQSIRGMVRFHLVGTEPDLAVYASPVNFDPDAPLFPISEPLEYAGDLAQRSGFITRPAWSKITRA